MGIINVLVEKILKFSESIKKEKLKYIFKKVIEI